MLLAVAVGCLQSSSATRMTASSQIISERRFFQTPNDLAEDEKLGENPSAARGDIMDNPAAGRGDTIMDQVVCVDLRMGLVPMESFVKNVLGRVETAKFIAKAVVDALGNGFSSESVLVGFYMDGKLKISITVPGGMDSVMVIESLKISKTPIVSAVSESSVHIEGEPYLENTVKAKKATSKEANEANGAVEPQETPAKKEAEVEGKVEKLGGQEEEEEDGIDGTIARLVVICCVAGGVVVAVLFVMCLPTSEEEHHSSARTTTLSDFSDGIQGVRYGVSDFNLLRARDR